MTTNPQQRQSFEEFSVHELAMADRLYIKRGNTKGLSLVHIPTLFNLVSQHESTRLIYPINVNLDALIEDVRKEILAQPTYFLTMIATFIIQEAPDIIISPEDVDTYMTTKYPTGTYVIAVYSTSANYEELYLSPITQTTSSPSPPSPLSWDQMVNADQIIPPEIRELRTLLSPPPSPEQNNITKENT